MKKYNWARISAYFLLVCILPGLTTVVWSWLSSNAWASSENQALNLQAKDFGIASARVYRCSEEGVYSSGEDLDITLKQYDTMFRERNATLGVILAVQLTELNDNSTLTLTVTCSGGDTPISDLLTVRGAVLPTATGTDEEIYESVSASLKDSSVAVHNFWYTPPESAGAQKLTDLRFGAGTWSSGKTLYLLFDYDTARANNVEIAFGAASADQVLDYNGDIVRLLIEAEEGGTA